LLIFCIVKQTNNKINSVVRKKEEDKFNQYLLKDKNKIAEKTAFE